MPNPKEKGTVLGEIEELVILAILRLEAYAYGVAIQELVEKATRRTVNVRGLYTTLKRLEEKGLIRTIEEGAPAPRGGRPRRYYAVEAAGKAALRQTAAQRKTWENHREAVDTVSIPALS
jgi:DNA-binding PadR family transcriptional regulator